MRTTDKDESNRALGGSDQAGCTQAIGAEMEFIAPWTTGEFIIERPAAPGKDTP